MLSPYFPIETRLQELGLVPVKAAPLDLIDEGTHYLIHAELPGFSKDNVEVQVDKDMLSIRAKKETEKEDKEKNYLRRERTPHMSGRFHSPRKSVPVMRKGA